MDFIQIATAILYVVIWSFVFKVISLESQPSSLFFPSNLNIFSQILPLQQRLNFGWKGLSSQTQRLARGEVKGTINVRFYYISASHRKRVGEILIIVISFRKVGYRISRLLLLLYEHSLLFFPASHTYRRVRIMLHTKLFPQITFRLTRLNIHVHLEW